MMEIGMYIKDDDLFNEFWKFISNYSFEVEREILCVALMIILSMKINLIINFVSKELLIDIKNYANLLTKYSKLQIRFKKFRLHKFSKNNKMNHKLDNEFESDRFTNKLPLLQKIERIEKRFISRNYEYFSKDNSNYNMLHNKIKTEKLYSKRRAKFQKIFESYRRFRQSKK